MFVLGRSPLYCRSLQLDERIDEHEANPDDVEPWAEVRDDILRKL